MLLAACIAYVLGGMPVLWNLAPQVAPIVFSGIGVAALVVCAALTRPWLRVDRSLLIAIIAYLALYIVGTYLSYALTGVKTAERWALLSTNTMVLGVGAFYFLAGGALGAERRWAIPAGLIVAYAIVALYVFTHWDVLTSADLIYRMRVEGDVYDYQQIGDSFALSALALMALWRLRSRRISRRSMVLAVGFVALSIVVLFVNPSRSAAFLGAFCLLLALVLSARGWWRVGLIVALLAGGAIVAMQPVSDVAEGSRFEALVDDPTTDKSVEGREEILEQGWNAISEHPFIGEWAFELERMGRSGLYIHNALDIWAQAGVAPFIAFLVVWGVVIRKLLKGWRASPRRYGAALPLVAFALLSWVVSRNAAYVLPFVGLGFFAAIIVRAESRQLQMKARRRQTSRRRSRQSRSTPGPVIASVQPSGSAGASR
ncbi:MAG: O-antigen ligase family protein [Burkholderiaceae bacterium]